MSQTGRLPDQLDKWHTKDARRSKCPIVLSDQTTTPNMRKIETQMVAAIQNDERWSSANTTVIPGWEGTSDVYLHGSRIATIGQDWMQLFDGGYQSKTTKSRLNALLSAFGMDGEYVFQKNFQWFVNYQGSPIPFFDGMRLA